MGRLTRRFTETLAQCPLLKIQVDDESYCKNQNNDCYTCELGRQLAKLADYEDAEEQGVLLRLPCRIGDTMWTIRRYRGVRHVQQGIVNEIFFNSKMRLIIVIKHVARGEFGETVFLTQAEAEKALAEMEGVHDAGRKESKER